MKKLLLVTGDLAAGKSTYADILSERCQTIVYHKDRIKEVLGDSIGFTTREENLKLSQATAGLMLHIFSEFAKQGMDIILESNFRGSELERLHEIARNGDYRVLTLVLRGDTRILYERYLNRIRYEHRHPVHLSTGFETFEDFEAYLEKARKTSIPGDTMKIDASDFSFLKDASLLERIDCFMNGRSLEERQ